MKIRTVLKL